MKELAFRYFVIKTDDTFVQFFRYIFVGGFSTVIDMGTFFVFNAVFETHYIVAQTIGFIFGLSVNYLLSIFWVFTSTGNLKKEFFLFSIIGIGGLFWSYLILWVLIDEFEFDTFQNMAAKTIAVILVLFWNFGMRKKFVF